MAVRHDQLDYVAPERFDLKYVGADNAEHRPVVIHRAIFGSFERFIAILIEHFAGAFPLWLAPVQAIVLPIADRHLDYAQVAQVDTLAQGRGRRPPGKGELQDSRGAAAKNPHAGCWGQGSGRPRGGRSQPEKGRSGARPLAQFVTDALAEVRAKALS